MFDASNFLQIILKLGVLLQGSHVSTADGQRVEAPPRQPRWGCRELGTDPLNRGAGGVTLLGISIEPQGWEMKLPQGSPLPGSGPCDLLAPRAQTLSPALALPLHPLPPLYPDSRMELHGQVPSDAGHRGPAWWCTAQVLGCCLCWAATCRLQRTRMTHAFLSTKALVRHCSGKGPPRAQAEGSVGHPGHARGGSGLTEQWPCGAGPGCDPGNSVQSRHLVGLEDRTLDGQSDHPGPALVALHGAAHCPQ